VLPNTARRPSPNPADAAADDVDVDVDDGKIDDADEWADGCRFGILAPGKRLKLNKSTT